jgi:hypothetical protein
MELSGSTAAAQDEWAQAHQVGWESKAAESYCSKHREACNAFSGARYTHVK